MRKTIKAQPKPGEQGEKDKTSPPAAKQTPYWLCSPNTVAITCKGSAKTVADYVEELITTGKIADDIT